MTFPSVVIQTYLTFTARRWAQFPTVTFTNGATAGFEVVSVDSSDNIFVQIQSGTTTMLQVKSAIEAHKATTGFSAGDLVSVAITSGHNSDTVKTLDGAILSGALTSSVAAYLSFGPLLVTALSAGTSGNSIRLELTSGAPSGTAVVTVSTNDISVQIDDGVTSFGTIMDAINADVSASALVLVTATRAAYANTTYPALDTTTSDDPNLVFVASLPSYTNLMGGLAASPATVTIQGITVTSNTNDSTQNGLTFSATTGATAGAEVVTVDGFGNVSVQIQNGVSTITQVVTALNAAGSFTALYAATGSGSTPILTVNGAVMAGAVGPSVAGTYGFFTDQNGTTLTTSYQWLSFGNVMGEIVFSNDDTMGSNKLSLSWDGINVHGIVLPNTSLSFDRCNKSGVYVKYVTGSPAFRISTVAQ